MDESLDLILKQTKNEANAYSYYYVLSFWFYENGFLKIYKWLSDQAKEELDHMDQFMKYYQYHINFVSKINTRVAKSGKKALCLNAKKNWEKPGDNWGGGA